MHKEKLVEDWSQEELVKVIARKYDDNTDYRAEWRELVKRVGESAAELLVDAA